LVIILAVVALLVFVGSKDFGRYAERTIAPAATATAQPGT
jgi:hypothetical protein